MQEKSKPSNANEETGLRNTFVRLQADIVESTMWPSLRVELVLSVVVYLQMFKYAFDYCSIVWNAPYGINETLFFSYLDIAHYERYLPEAVFVNLLYIVMGLIGFYVVCFAYLLRPIFDGGIHTLLKKIMKVLMELFSGLLFMPIVRTIVNNQTCSMGVQSAVMACLSPNGSLTVTIVSFVLLFLFTLLLMVQCVLRYEFIPSDQPKVIRNSSRSHCLQLLYVLGNQLVVLLANGIATVIVLNSLAILLLLYSLLVEEYVTPSARKLHFSFLALNLTLVVLTDISYLSIFNIPLFVWLSMTPLIVCTVWMQRHLDIRNELDNINKWTTPADMLRYCAGLRSLVASPSRPRNMHLINGYCDVHRQKCEQPTCPIRLTPQALKKLRTFNPQATRGKSNEVLMIEELVKKIYTQGVKFFPTNASLELQFAHFLYCKEMKEQALKELLQMDLDDASLDQYYKYHRLKYRIHREISARNTHSCLDMLSELQMNRKEEDFMKLLEKTALADLEFWGVLNEDHPDFLKLDQIGVNRMKLGGDVERLYREITEIGNSQRTTFLYVLYLVSVDKQEREFNDIYEEVRQHYSLGRRITIEDWANSSNCILLLNGEEDKFGNVTDLNLSAASFLGYEKYELLNRNVSMLLCPIFEERVSEFITGKTLEQQNMLHADASQLQSIIMGSSLQSAQNPTHFYLVKKNGYCVPVSRRIQVFNSMSRGFIYMCTLESAPRVEQQGFMLCNQQGKVMGVSSSCISLIGIDLKFISFRDSIDIIFPELLGQLEGLIERPERRLVKELFSEEVIEKSGIDEAVLDAEVKVRAERIDESGFVLIFEKVDKPSINNSHLPTKVHHGDFALSFNMRTAKTTPTICGTRIAGGQSFGCLAEPVEMNEDITNIVLEERLDYGQGIRTVRLYDNEVDVIEESEDGDKLYQQEKANIMQNELHLKLGRKHQESIFQSKQSLLDFLDNYQSGRFVKVFLAVAAVLHIGLFVLVFVLFNQHNSSTADNFGQLVYESRKIGELQTIYSTLQSYELIAAGGNSSRLPMLASWLNESELILQGIKDKGIKPYPVQVKMADGTPKTFFSDEFIESYLNNADICLSQYGPATNSSSLATQNNSNAQVASLYVRRNGYGTHQQMTDSLNAKFVSNGNQLFSYITSESIVLAVCYFFEIVFTAVAVWLFYSVYNEKIKVLKIFLSVPEHQILLFSSRSERFLTSLHVEDNEVEEDEEAFSAERTNKNSFAVKKKFKVVKRQNSVYFRFLLIPLVIQLFYALSFATSQGNLAFMKETVQYANQTSSAKRILQWGLAGMQQHLLTNTSVVNPASDYIAYYERLFDLHEKTLSQDFSYHSYFIQLMMTDICNGSVSVPQACELDISSNGTLILFTDMTVITAYSDITSDFSDEYYLITKIIGRVHDLLSDRLLATQMAITSTVCRTLLNYFFVFLFGSLAVFLFYGVPLVNLYLTKINCTKRMLGLLPLSVVKESEEIHSYFQEVIDKGKLCLN